MHRLIYKFSRMAPHGMMFEASLDGEVIGEFRDVLHEGARELQRRGYSGLMTTRPAGKSYDSFQPIEIAEAAKWKVAEGMTEGPYRRLRRSPDFSNAKGGSGT